jgi:hypothetical protein
MIDGPDMLTAYQLAPLDRAIEETEPGRGEKTACLMPLPLIALPER